MSKTTPPADAPKLHDVKLLKAHTHAGQTHPIGATVQVDDTERQWLIEQEVIANPDAKAE